MPPWGFSTKRFPGSPGANQTLPRHPWGGIAPAPSALCCSCCFAGTSALRAAWPCHTRGSCWPCRLVPAPQEQALGPAPSPKLYSHPGLTKLHLCILPSSSSLCRCFPSCRKCQILDCPGQERCSALALWHPQKSGTGGSSWVDVSQLPPFPSLHHCHQKSQFCFIVKQEEMLITFLFSGQLYPLLSTKHGTEPGTAPACKRSHWADSASWKVQE